MVTTSRETVLRLLVEGGSVTIFRSPIGTGAWEFFAETGGMTLDENDDEIWRYSESARFLSIEETLESIVPTGAWAFWLPTEIHPEYRQLLWKTVQEITANISIDRPESWLRTRKIWRRRCASE